MLILVNIPHVHLLGLTKTLKSPLSTNPKASSNSSPVEKAIRSPSSSNKEKKTQLIQQLSNRCQHLEQYKNSLKVFMVPRKK